ncbi:MAG: hypothetical protein ACXQS7_06000 [Candidatus Syntropharchaeia archaeon]
MEEIEWVELDEVDLFEATETGLTPAGVERFAEEGLEKERIGVRARDSHMVDEFITRMKQRARGRNAEYLEIDYRGCSSTEDYQERIIKAISEYVAEKYPDKEIPKEGALNERTTACLVILEDIANELRKNFTLIIDIRGIKITPKILRPGQFFWWVYDSATRADPSNLLWIMDDDEDAFEILSSHGQMRKIFSDEGTNTFILI